MALDITYTIKIGQLGSEVDFTSRCAGFSIKQNAPISNLEIGRAQITLLNYDGALTPNAGGTYSSTDWFEQAVFISATIDGTNTLTAELFHGTIASFNVADNGNSSTVEIICTDSLRFLGSTTDSFDFSLLTFIDDGFTNTIAAAASLAGIEPPKLGKTTATYGSEYAAVDNANKVDSSNMTAGTIADALRNQLLPSYPSAYWATTIQEGSPSTNCSYTQMVAGASLTRPTSSATWYLERSDLEFTESASTAGQIGFKFLDIGFNNDQIVNEVVQKTSATGNTSTASDSTSVGKYGNRAYTTSSAINKTDAAAQDAANNFLNRQLSSRYVPFRLTTNTSLLNAAHADTDYAVRSLLDIRSALWNFGTVTYTPTGSASTETEGVVVTGRSMTATPSDTTIVLELLPAVDYQSFVLDSDVLGVLDQNRLG